MFAFGLYTCGGEMRLAMEIFKYHPLDSSYSLVLPNNYMIFSALKFPIE